MPRIFIVDQREFPDPDPTLTVEQVREMMASFYPELANATHTERQRDEDTVYEFQRRVGTKGEEYAVALYFTGSVTIRVEAGSEDEAIEKAKEDVAIVNPMALENLELSDAMVVDA